MLFTSFCILKIYLVFSFVIVCCEVPKTLESVYASVKILHQQHSRVGFDGPKDAPTFHLNYSTARKGNNNCVRVIEQSGTYSERERERERERGGSSFYFLWKRALCPLCPQTLHSLFLFGGGSGDGVRDIGLCGLESVVGLGTFGSGHTISFVSSVQKSLILSYRYHCLFGERPGGGITLGRTLGSGSQSCFRRLMLFSSPLADIFLYTVPLSSDLIVKWWYFFIWSIFFP